MRCSLNNGRRPSDQVTAGFGALDLLVTIAAILLLAAIGVPILLKQYRQSQRAKCTGNLQQVTRAVLQYAQENNGTLPVTVNPGKPVWWWYKESVKSYAGVKTASSEKDRVFACPADRGYDDPSPERPVAFWRQAKFDFGSYNFNGVDLPGMPHIAGRTVNSIKEPNRTLLMMEWSAHGPLSWHNSRTGRKNVPFYNDAQSVVGFVDGHVDYIKIHFDGINAAYTRDPVPGYAYKYSGD